MFTNNIFKSKSIILKGSIFTNIVSNNSKNSKGV